MSVDMDPTCGMENGRKFYHLHDHCSETLYNAVASRHRKKDHLFSHFYKAFTITLSLLSLLLSSILCFNIQSDEM